MAEPAGPPIGRAGSVGNHPMLPAGERMPTRPTVLTEGEGPFNDACALTTYRVAVRGGFSRRARRASSPGPWPAQA